MAKRGREEGSRSLALDAALSPGPLDFPVGSYPFSFLSHEVLQEPFPTPGTSVSYPLGQ